MTDLHSASREELLEMVLGQQAQIEALVARVAELEEEVRRTAAAPRRGVLPGLRRETKRRLGAAAATSDRGGDKKARRGSRGDGALVREVREA